MGKIIGRVKPSKKRSEGDLRIVARYLLDTSEYYFDEAKEDAENLSNKEFKKYLALAKKMGYDKCSLLT